MKKLVLTNCKICKKEFSTQGVSQHVLKTHGIKFKDYLIRFELDGKTPLCKCGCSTPVTIRGSKIMDYVDGHCDASHFKSGVNLRKNEEQWKENLKIGIRKYNDLAKKENPEYRSGTNNQFFGKKHTEESKTKIKEKVEEQIKAGNHPFLGNINGRIGKSSLEIKFEEYLKSIRVGYKHNYRVSYIPENKTSTRYKYYDFFLPDKNLLVEIHGSYWHPEKIESLSEMQFNNLENDRFKKQLAKDRNHDLLVIYDYELDNFISENLFGSIDCFFTVNGTRQDIDKLVIKE